MVSHVSARVNAKLPSLNELSRPPEILGIFICSRILLLFVAWVGRILIPVNAAVSSAQPDGQLNLFANSFTGDATAYQVIGQFGYWFDPSSGIGSPPLLPFFTALTRLASVAVGEWAAAFVIANLAFLLALFILDSWLRSHVDAPTARRSLILLTAFPFAYLFAIPTAEPLGLLLVAVGLWSLERERLGVAALGSALAVLTVPTGIALLPPLISRHLNRRTRTPRHRWLLGWLFLLAPPLAMAAFVAFLLKTTAMPEYRALETIFGSIRPNFLNGSVFSQGLLPNTSTVSPAASAAFPVSLGVVLTLGALALTPMVFRRLGAPYGWYHLSLLALAIITRPTTLGPALVLDIPAFVIVAAWLRNELAQTMTVALLAIPLALLTSRYITLYPTSGENVNEIALSGQKVIAAFWRGRLVAPSTSVTRPQEILLSVEHRLLLLGVELPTTQFAPSEHINIPLDGYVTSNLPTGYVFQIRLIGQDQKAWQAGDRVLWGTVDRTLYPPLPPTTISVGEYIQQDLPMAIPADIPTGAYSLNLYVFHAVSWSSVSLVNDRDHAVDHATLATVIVSNRADLGPPTTIAIPHPTHAIFGDSLTLVGYDVGRNRVSGVPVPVTLYWQTGQKLTKNYTISVQALDPSGHLIAQADSFPLDGRFPTSDIPPGDILRDVHNVALPSNAQPSEWIVGVYQLATLQRLPVHQAGIAGIGDHAILESLPDRTSH